MDSCAAPFPRASEKVLTEQLRQLEQCGVVERQVVETMPPQVTYLLTEHGRALKASIDSVCDWGIQHAALIGAQILIVDSQVVNSQADKMAESPSG